MVTEHGQAAGVIVDPESWALLNSRLDLLEAIALGMQDLGVGRVTAQEHVNTEFAPWLN